MLEGLIGFLKEKDIKFEENERLDKISYMKLGGVARLSASPKTENEFCSLLSYLTDKMFRYKVIGRMSNILPTDDVYDGILVKTHEMQEKTVAENKVTVQCGATLAEMIWFCAHVDLGGAEELFMIPATIGGAVFNNAGAHGKEISDIFVSARLYFPLDKSILVYSREDMRFNYRDSILKHREIYLLSATFRFESSDFPFIKNKVEHFARLRRSFQPLDRPSLGSTFKRYEGVSAGYYIDRAGLKGCRVGGAMVSEKHAGFIVNAGGATASDVKQLIECVKQAVFDRFGIWLQEEIEFL